MKTPTSTPKASKEVQSLLNKAGYISERDLAELDLATLDGDILDALLAKINPGEKTKAKAPKTELSIYKEQDEFMKAEGLTSLKGHAKERYFQKKRQTIRNGLHALAQKKAPKTELMAYLKAHYTKADLTSIPTFIGGSKSPVLKLELLAYLKNLK